MSLFLYHFSNRIIVDPVLLRNADFCLLSRPQLHRPPDRRLHRHWLEGSAQQGAERFADRCHQRVNYLIPTHFYITPTRRCDQRRRGDSDESPATFLLNDFSSSFAPPFVKNQRTINLIIYFIRKLRLLLRCR